MPTLSSLGTIPESPAVSAAARAKPHQDDGRPGRAAASGRHAHYMSRALLQAGPVIFAALILSLIVTAYIYRHDGPLTAESGPGYWLGIAGGITMLLLTGYPLRKRIKSMARVGRVSSWFRLHMILGILGPTLVILHTNFKLGSLNSRLALMTMLIVVFSGIAGRYLYAKVHRGLYGKQMAMRDILDDIVDVKAGLTGEVMGHRDVIAELERYVPKAGQHTTPRVAPFGAVQTRASRRKILKLARLQLDQHPRTSRWARRRKRRHVRSIDAQLRTYFAAVNKARRFAVFERLFGLWHHLHMPLFLLLVITVTLHIIAVHLY